MAALIKQVVLGLCRAKPLKGAEEIGELGVGFVGGLDERLALRAEIAVCIGLWGDRAKSLCKRFAVVTLLPVIPKYFKR